MNVASAKWMLGAVLLLAAGCHPSKSGGWPADAKRDFIQGCRAHSATPERCACAADALEKTTPWAQFDALARASNGGKSPSPEFAKLVKTVDARCAKQVKPAAQAPGPAAPPKR